MVLMRKGGEGCLDNISNNQIVLKETHEQVNYGFNQDEKEFKSVFIGFCMAIILILMGALTLTIVISLKQKKAKIDSLVVKD